MGRFLATIVTALWGLWFGGVVMLFIAVSSLFNTFHDRHDLAGQGAAPIFRTFNVYQLAIAALVLIATFAWYLIGRPRLKMGLFLLFGLATFAACVITIYVAPQIAAMQQNGLTHSPEFNRMHGYSMIAYLVEAVALLLAGLLLPWLRD